MNTALEPKRSAATQHKAGGPRRPAEIWKLFESFGPVILLIAVVGIITIIRPSFILPANLLTVGLQASVNAVLAVGMTLAIVSGGIHLSVGTTLALGMVVQALSANNFRAPMY